jgi:hypothetical protein
MLNQKFEEVFEDPGTLLVSDFPNPTIKSLSSAVRKEEILEETISPAQSFEYFNGKLYPSYDDDFRPFETNSLRYRLARLLCELAELKSDIDQAVKVSSLCFTFLKFIRRMKRVHRREIY